jgi:hypothetical protein
MSDRRGIPYLLWQWVGGERFYGCRTHLLHILEGPRESSWLLGTRRVGKTSVHSQSESIATETPELGYLPLFWDFQDAGDTEEPHLTFYDSLLDSEQRVNNSSCLR